VGQQRQNVNREYDAEAGRLEAEHNSLTSSREWQIAKTAADVAGIVDPTPVSDIVGGAMSLAEGDIVGGLLSGVSLLPYLGDAIAKPLKGTRAAKRLAELAEQIGKITKRLDHLKDKFARQREAARRVREARRRGRSIEECKAQGKWGTQLPTTGKWEPPNSKGHGRWTSEDGAYSVEYREGYPDFSTAKGPPSELGAPYRGKVEIEQTGNNYQDFKAADAEWKRVTGQSKPEGYTWNHSEDGVTMELVRTDVHDRGISGAAHTGGASIVKSQEF
jgi:A nuclease of the HNH/ENDO VII superfamily with conserved WHH